MCPHPPHMHNASLDVKGLEYKSTVVVWCFEGFKSIYGGKKSMVSNCNGLGEWDPPTRDCIGM